MRAFVALEIPQKIKKETSLIQKDLKKAGLQAKWVEPENLHLTLAFLGKIKPETIKPLNRILEKSVRGIKPVKLHFLKIGAFPSPTRARVVFLDLGGEKGKLHALALKIRKELRKEKIWFDEKPFQAHLTLGRFRKRQDLKAELEKIKIKKITLAAHQVTLNQSQLTQTGPCYTQLKCLSLA